VSSPFSCFALLVSFSAVPTASGPVFMFFAPELVFGGTEGRLVLFSCFALPDSFSMVRTASGPVFLFCAPGLVFGDTEGVRSYFQVLRSRTHFRWFRGRQVPFSCCARPYSFSAVPCASGPVVMFCARTRFRPYRGGCVPFSCFALSDSFSTVPRASLPVFMSLPDSFSALPRGSCSVFMFCAPGLVFGGTGGVVSRFLVLRSRTRFRRFHGRRVPFLYFTLPDSLLEVPRASGPV
jgi:hypothetical protein